MSTITAPHSEYSSLNNASSSPQANNYDRTKIDFKADNKQNSTKQKTTSSPTGLQEESSVLVGIFNDVFKNVAKILTGSLLTDVLKSLLKDGGQTWQEVVYKSLMDSGPSRFFNDIANSLAVRFFNGNHSFFGMFKVPYLPPEISSQICSIPLVSIFRAATADFNVNAKSARNNMSDKEKAIFDEVHQQNRWFLRFCKWIKGEFKEHVKPKLDTVFSKCFGVHAGKIIKDKRGKDIYEDKGKPLYSNQEVNKKHLFGIMAGTYLGSFFLPQHTTAFGFEKAKNPLRALLSTITTSLFRLNTTLIHNGIGMHYQGGKNFDSCFRTSVVEKMLVPFTQYACDAVGALLSTRLPINGATLAMTLRFLAEVPATFLSSGLVNVAKKDRMNNDWRYISNKVWKPIAGWIERTTKPIYALVAKFYGYAMGMFDPRIPNMYNCDIRNEKTKARDHLDPEVLQEFKPGFFNTGALFAKKAIQIPLKDIWELGRRCRNDSLKRETKIDNMVKKVNEGVDLKSEALLAMKERGIDEAPIRLSKYDKDLSQKVIKLATDPKTNNEQMIAELVSMPGKNSQEAKISIRKMKEELEKKKAALAA